jgi:NADPH-dependent glutamate synthase beta subunit-like oxidoreductase
LTGAMDVAAELRRSKAKRRRWEEEEDEIVSYLMTMNDSSPEKSDESQEFLTILREEQIRRKYEDQLYRKEQMKFQKEDHALNTIKVIGDRMRALESQSGGKDTETYSQLERIYNKALDILEK